MVKTKEEFFNDDISELCQFCRVAEHTDKLPPPITKFNLGCEGSYCDEAYEKYLGQGQKVTYVTDYKKEKGIVKSICDDGFVFVVYNCGGNWGNYKDYTAAKTKISDLERGWVV